MATMIEKQLAKAQKDVEKYTKAIERYTAQLAKKTAICEKLNCNWTQSEWFEHRDAGDFTPEQDVAYFERTLKESYVEDAERGLAQAQKHLAKITGQYEVKAEKDAEAERIDSIENDLWQSMTKAEKREAQYEAWLKQFKAECLKDGVVIEEVLGCGITGKTADGKNFGIWNNNGWTVRSRHCYSLVIAGEMIFTSGEFYTAYRYIKK